MKMYRHAFACAVALAACPPLLAETYRCQRADGAITFRQAPCPVAELAMPQRPLDQPPDGSAVPRPAGPQAPGAAPATAALSAPDAPAARTPRPPSLREVDEPYELLTRRKREVLDLTARLERCRADQPGFAASSAPLYQAWLARHEETLSAYPRLLTLKVREVRRSEAMPLAECSQEWLRSLEPLARPPDPRFRTVEDTWAVFVAALLAADRATLMDCVTGTAAARLKERIDALSDADLRRMGAAIRGLKVQWGDDYDKEALFAHEDGVDGIVFRNVNEEWKIGGL